MKKILYNVGTEQRLEDFHESGSTSAEVVWDTMIHGPLPADAPVGYAERWEEIIVRKTIRQVPAFDEKGEPILDESGKQALVDKEEDVPETFYRLRENAALNSAKAARDAAKSAADAKDATDKADFASLNAKIKDDTATDAEVRKVLKHLLNRLGE